MAWFEGGGQHLLRGTYQPLFSFTVHLSSLLPALLVWRNQGMVPEHADSETPDAFDLARFFLISLFYVDRSEKAAELVRDVNERLVDKFNALSNLEAKTFAQKIKVEAIEELAKLYDLFGSTAGVPNSELKKFLTESLYVGCNDEEAENAFRILKRGKESLMKSTDSNETDTETDSNYRVSTYTFSELAATNVQGVVEQLGSSLSSIKVGAKNYYTLRKKSPWKAFQLMEFEPTPAVLAKFVLRNILGYSAEKVTAALTVLERR